MSELKNQVCHFCKEKKLTLTEETYNKARPGGDLSHVKKNINQLIELNKIEKKLTISAVFTIKEINAHEKDMFFNEYIDKVDIIEFYHYYGGKKYFK